MFTIYKLIGENNNKGPFLIYSPLRTKNITILKLDVIWFS